MYGILTVLKRNVTLETRDNVAEAQLCFEEAKADRDTVAAFMWLEKFGLIDKFDTADKIKDWIWRKVDKHGSDNLVAVMPTFDLILNKIEELK